MTAFVPSASEAIRLAITGEKEEPGSPAPFGAWVFVTVMVSTPSFGFGAFQLCCVNVRDHRRKGAFDEVVIRWRCWRAGGRSVRFPAR